MRANINEIMHIKNFFLNFPTVKEKNEAKEYGLKLAELSLNLTQEVSMLREEVQINKDQIEWLQKKADEWMLKAMQNQQIQNDNSK